MDLNQLEIFAKVVEEGGFSAAARALGMPKSSVSRKVAQLEESLGARLLSRSTRSVEPTEVGAAFYARCARIMEKVREAEASVLEATSEPRGKLRVSAPVDLAEVLMGPIAAEYLARYPEVELELDFSGRVVDLIGEGFDLAVRAGNLSDSSLIARKLSETPTAFYASPEYVARRGAPTHPDQLKDHDCIVFGSTSRRRILWKMRHGRALFEVELKGRLRVNDLRAARAAAVAGAGITFQPAFSCVADVEEGRLVRVLEESHLGGGALYAVYPPNPHVPPKLRAFLDLLVERIDSLL